MPKFNFFSERTKGRIREEEEEEETEREGGLTSGRGKRRGERMRETECIQERGV